MNKFLCAIISALLSVSILAGCGKTESAKSSSVNVKSFMKSISAGAKRIGNVNAGENNGDSVTAEIADNESELVTLEEANVKIEEWFDNAIAYAANDDRDGFASLFSSDEETIDYCYEIVRKYMLYDYVSDFSYNYRWASSAVTNTNEMYADCCAWDNEFSTDGIVQSSSFYSWNFFFKFDSDKQLLGEKATDEINNQIDNDNNSHFGSDYVHTIVNDNSFFFVKYLTADIAVPTLFWEKAKVNDDGSLEMVFVIANNSGADMSNFQFYTKDEKPVTINVTDNSGKDIVVYNSYSTLVSGDIHDLPGSTIENGKVVEFTCVIAKEDLPEDFSGSVKSVSISNNISWE